APCAGPGGPRSTHRGDPPRAKSSRRAPTPAMNKQIERYAPGTPAPPTWTATTVCCGTQTAGTTYRTPRKLTTRDSRSIRPERILKSGRFTALPRKVASRTRETVARSRPRRSNVYVSTPNWSSNTSAARTATRAMRKGEAIGQKTRERRARPPGRLRYGLRTNRGDRKEEPDGSDAPSGADQALT